MPGIATLFEVLELTIDRMGADPQLAGFATAMKNQSGFAHLGALGPTIADFFPDPPTANIPKRANYRLVWALVFHALSGDPGGTPRPGIFPTLTSLKAIVTKVQKIADDEDLLALLGLVTSGEIDTITQAADDVKTAVKGITDDARGIAAMIATALRPEVDTATKSDPVPAPKDWRTRDFLHWKKTGLFVGKLIDKANHANDPTLRDQMRAYAFGYLVSYACKVCGSPFLNSIVGGPYRTQWWRQRLVRNYVDAWVYGFYRETPRPTFGPDDQPAPGFRPYDQWHALCGANLQKKLNLGPNDPHDANDLLRILGQAADELPHPIPPAFADLWMEAFHDTYGFADVPPGFVSTALNLAYCNTWLMLWVQTSGEVLDCDPGSIKPPDTCGKDADELSPFKADEHGNPTPAPPAKFDEDVDVDKLICAAIEALFGGLAALGLGLAVGAPAIVSALKDAHDAVDWAKLRCQLYWYRMYLYNAIVGMKRMLALTGFGYPDPTVFHEDTQALQLLKVNKPMESARVLVKSQLRERFPSKVWITVDASDHTDPGDPQFGLFLAKVFDHFEKPPDAADPGFESNAPNDPTGLSTVAYETAAFPPFFIDDPGNPLSNGDVKTGGGFPFRRGVVLGGGVLPAPFGNVVDNALDLFRHLGQPFPDWNLDGDRGLGWFTWQFKGVYDPDAVQYEKEP